MLSPIISFIAQCQDTLYSSVFGFSIGDDIVLSSSTESGTATLQSRSNEGSSDWTDTSISASVSTTANAVINYSELTPVIKAGYVYRFRFSTPLRVWIGIDSSVNENLLGTSPLPTIKPPSSNKFVPIKWPPIGDVLRSLPTDSVVLIFMGGQSIWQGIVQYTGNYPAKSKFWDGNSFEVINTSNGYRGTAAPTIGLALQFEEEYPDLELWVAENGKGGTGFHSDGFEVGGTERLKLIKTLTDALAFTESQNRNVYFLGTIWNQGSADAYNPHAPLYESALQGLVQEIDALTDFSSPFITTRSNADPDTFGLIDVIREVHESYPFVDVDDIEQLSDKLHYGVASSMEIGRRQLALIKVQEINKIADYIEPPVSTAQDYNFQGITELPTGFNLVSTDTPTFASTYTEINRGSVNNWSTAFLESPVLNSPIEITHIAQGLGAIGIARDYATGLFNGADSLIVTQGGNVLLRGNTVGTVTATQFGKTYRTTFTASGSDVTVEQYNVTDDVSDGTVLVENGVFPNTRAVIDSAYTDQRIVRIREVT